MNAKHALEIWGLRTTGGSFKGLKASSGCPPGAVDDELFFCWHLERCPGFEMARPVLLHVYAYGQPEETFVIRGPGETLARALMRLGWYGFIHHPLPEIPFRVRDEFEPRLGTYLLEHPFHKPTHDHHEPIHIPDGYVQHGSGWRLDWVEWTKLQTAAKKS